jgi:hypothetical protein
MRASVAAAIDTLGCKAKNPKSRVKLVQSSVARASG